MEGDESLDVIWEKRAEKMPVCTRLGLKFTTPTAGDSNVGLCRPSGRDRMIRFAQGLVVAYLLCHSNLCLTAWLLLTRSTTSSSLLSPRL